MRDEFLSFLSHPSSVFLNKEVLKVADFNAAHQQVMGNEGGYANNPADAGGETYKGIARKFWPQWCGWKYVDGVKANTIEPPVRGTQAYQNYVAYLNRSLAG